jgi:thiamine biosynthesis lipoprotein
VIERDLAGRLAQLEAQFSTYRPDSALSRFNATRHTDWIAVPPELARVAARAREISALTAGAFDPTVAPLLQLWGFGPSGARQSWPSASELTAARALVDWHQLEVRSHPPGLRKTAPELAADFSSVAKGFSVDELSATLSRLGAPNHLVQIGGDLRAAGPGPEGRGWRVAIEQPEAGPRRIARVIPLLNQALSTSGNHRNFVILDGRRVGHLLDPRTGLPADSTLRSVSVVHGSCATSSALATGLFVLGPSDGPALARRENLAALFIGFENGELEQRASPSFAQHTPDG